MILLFFRHALPICFFIIIFNFTFAQSPKADSLYKVLKKHAGDTNRVNTLNELCRVLSSSDMEKFRQVANEAVTLAQRIAFARGEADAYKNLGFYYYRVGNAPRSIEFQLKALRIYEKIGVHTMIGASYNNIGLIYMYQDDLDEAFDYFSKALSLWKKHNYTEGIIRALGNIASIYEKRQIDSLALDYYIQSLQLAKQINAGAIVSRSLREIGGIYFKKKEFATSMTYQKQALRFAIESGSEEAQASVYNAMSQVHLALGQPQKALLDAERALEISQRRTSKNDEADSYFQIYKAHEKLNNYKKAYEFLSIYVTLKDSLKKSENLGSIEKLRSRYELEKKEAEILLLTERHEAEEFRRNIFFLGALCVLLIAGFLFYNRFRLTTQRQLALKKQRLDFYTNKLIEKSEAMERIDRELEQFKNSGSQEDTQIAKINRILQSNILTSEDWENFKKAFEEIYPAFFLLLRHKYPAITVSELRLSALIKLNLSIKETATMLGISPESVKTSRYRLKKKFGLTEDETIEEFIEKLKVPAQFKIAEQATDAP